MFWRKREENVKSTRQQIQEHREKLAKQVVDDLREQQIGPDPDYPVKPNQPIEEHLLLARLGVPPKRYIISSTAEIKTVTPRIKATLPDEQEVIDDINSVRRLNKTFFGDD